MKPNDQAYQAALRATSDSCSAYQIQNALDAAYAVQFQPSEDYAGLITELRMGWATKEKNDRAADAIEAVLAERDALKAELATANKRAANRLAVEAERDALKAELEKAQDIARVQAERIGGYIKTIEDRNVLLARLAPVDDEATVRERIEIRHYSDCAVNNEPASPAGECDCGGYTLEKEAMRLTKENLKLLDENARLIEEREKCVKAVEKVAERINVAHHERSEWEDGYLQGVHDASAAIRSGK